MKERIAVAAMILYIIVAILTFGHVASGNYQACIEARQRNELTSCGADFSAYAGLLAGMVWPLYWSWELQS